jgi:uncharacterized protein with PQ loop repeat
VGVTHRIRSRESLREALRGLSVRLRAYPLIIEHVFFLITRSDSMSTVHPGGPAAHGLAVLPATLFLGRVLRVFSVLTMLMTVPQVITVWMVAASGVSVLTWLFYLFSAILWLVYGVRKRDKTIYLACIGWIVLDAAIVIGVLLHR